MLPARALESTPMYNGLPSVGDRMPAAAAALAVPMPAPAVRLRHVG
jgi:hypothetical protein